MQAKVTKIQILTDRGTGNPIFYCHASDAGHDPELAITFDAGEVKIVAHALFKVKANPQTKNRVDIYMSIDEARGVGRALLDAAGNVRPEDPRVSNADPHGARAGAMELPEIVWSRYLRPILAAAKSVSGVRLKKEGGWMNVDLETRHETHIRMGEREIHIGITLDAPIGRHDPAATTMVMVDESELQRPRNRAPEANPVPKVDGAVLARLRPEAAAGLGLLLIGLD